MIMLAMIMSCIIIPSVVLPLKLKWYWKIFLSLAVAGTSLKFHVFRFFGGPMFFAPELPEWLLFAGAWVYSVLFIFFMLLLPTVAVRLVIGVFRRDIIKVFQHKASFILNAALLVLALILGSVGIACGTALPEVKKVTLALPELPEKAENMTIALLADLHADKLTRADRIRKIVELTNSLKADYVCIVGDFVDGKVDSCGQELLPLAQLESRCGVYGVPGNHEYYSGFEPWMKFLQEKCSVRMLINSAEVLPQGVILAGIADRVGKRWKQPVADIGKALANVPANGKVIMLSHRPDAAHEAAKDPRVKLMLAGHTHGGMIYGMDHFVASANSGFVSGLYRLGELLLYVSNGTGIWNGFPVRLGKNAEITLIRLVRAADGKGAKS